MPVYGENIFSRMTAILFDSLRGPRAPEPRGSGLVGAARPHAPGRGSFALPGAKGESGATRPRTRRFTISHLNALRAAVRIEAYGLYAQK